MKIKSITLNHFRGATRPLTIPFDVRKKFTLIYGENGTGKSSIVDALEFLFDQKRNSAFLSVNSTSATPEVKITDEAGYEYTTGSTIPEKVAILRRSFMSELCTQSASDFYAFFQEFLDLSQFQKSEQNLQKLTKTLNKKCKDLFLERSNLILEIEDIYRQHISAESAHPIEDAKEYAKREMKTQFSIQREANLLLSRHSQLQNLLTQRSGILSQLQAKSSELKQIAKILDVRLISLLKLLDEATQIIQADESTPATCPVCEQVIKKDEVLASLARRKKEIEEIKSLNTKKEQLEENIKKFNLQQTNFEDQIKQLISQPLEITELTQYALDIKPESSWEEITKALKDWEPNIAILNERKDNLESVLDIFGQIKSKVSKLGKLEKEFKTTHLCYRKAENLVNILKNTRHAYVQKLLNSLTGTICGFYEQMHSGEGISTIKLSLKENQNKSLEVLADFYGKTNVKPKDYYSEAHLDSLALSIFLAVSKAQNKKILILDDILTSLDLPHLQRILTQLKQLIGNNTFSQIILTTHIERLRNECKFRGSGSYDVIELKPWAINTGIFPKQQFQTLLDELNKALSNPQTDKNELALKAGLQLDSVLSLLCEAYHLPLAYGKEKHTLGEYLVAINKKLKKQLKVIIPNEGEKPLEELLQKCYDYSWIRNEYAHINLKAEVSESEVHSFALDVKALSEVLFCQQCGTYITKHNKQKGIRSCPNECKKLEPVELV